MNKYLVTARCVVDRDGKFFVIKIPPGRENEGSLSFLSGRFDTIDETPGHDSLSDTAARKVFAEIGMFLQDPIIYITSNFFVNPITGTPTIDVVFYCQLKKTIPVIIPMTYDQLEYYWLTAEEINQREDAPALLKNYINYLQRISFVRF